MNISQSYTKRQKRPLPERVVRESRPDYARYESLKSQLSDDLTPSEYSNAVRDIARECGV